LDPSNGALSGAPGDSVGWGFTLTNTSDTDWAAVVLTDYCPADVIASPCSTNGYPDVGNYSDIAGNNFVTIAPDSSVTQAFDVNAYTGLGYITIAGIPVVDSVTGEVVVTYDEFDSDPNVDGNQIGGDESVDASASVDVTSSESMATPEPGTMLLLATGLAALFSRRAGTKGA
jgi:uncharacterized repeat protein (TIGR01451 family)